METSLLPPHNNLPWLPAQVPGHVHLDLARAGVISDPFVRLHERDVTWVDDTDWIYETTFTPDAQIAAGAALFLHFQGLDTVAEIELNGETLGTTDNMYVAHEFPVTGQIRSGENTVRVTFRSARRTGLERRTRWNDEGNEKVTDHWDSWGARSFVRKAQYMYGWDWGPILISCGIWKPVELIAIPVARLLEWRFETEWLPDGSIVVSVFSEFERGSDSTKRPLIFTISSDGQSDFESVRATVGEGMTTAQVSVTIPNSKRWEPNGVGIPHLYPIRLQLSDAETGNNVDSITASVGLRTVELVQEPDPDGKGAGFKFRINGSDLFIKGANWIPNESFPSKGEVRTRIRQAYDAGYNMLRVWGGGLYESDEFYDSCDALGILVWQDFPYACAYYPDTGAYAEASRVEATAAVKVLRNRASLALWCGNNENYGMFEDRWGGVEAPRLLGEHLYETILPEIVRQEDPGTPYWPSSPLGGPNINSFDYGDCHNWDVWHGRGDWVYYSENNCRFCSEFGFISSCGLAAWESCLAPEDKAPDSVAVRWHDKSRKGYETYIGYIGIHFPLPGTLEDLVYLSQINQAEALKFGVEHYRRLKGRCWGTLFWQLNDCWPVQSWAVIDSLGEPKAAYFASKRFYAPLLVSLVREGQTVTAHLINDLLKEAAGKLTLTLERVDGTVISEQVTYVTIGANGAGPVAAIDCAQAEGSDRQSFVSVRFEPMGEEGAVENLLLLAEPKELALRCPDLVVEAREDGSGALELSVTALHFAPYVWLRRKDSAVMEVSDNFFHLRAGETKLITVRKSKEITDGASLKRLLAVRTLQTENK